MEGSNQKNSGEKKNLLQQLDKQFGLTNLAVENKTTVFFLTFLIVLSGLLSYISLPKENFPEVKMPTVYIGTPYPGNSPVDMENLVTRLIEKELNTVANVDNIKSTSVQDHSTIIVEFTSDVNIDNAVQKVKDAVDKVKPDLPKDLPADPNVFELNFSEFPILNINLAGNYSTSQLNDWAEELKDEIEKMSEISYAEIRGVDEKEIKIQADPYEMESRKINFGDIEQAIANENTTQSGGLIKEEGLRRTIRIDGEYDNTAQIENTIIKSEKGNIVYLKDVASVVFEYKEKQNYARLYNNNVVMVDVVKRSGQNLLEATDKINSIIANFKEEVPSDLKVVITNDQSQQTRQMVSDLENNIISGVILVVVVLLFFLGSRNALFVGIAIPLSMFITFIVLGTFNITINMMVLFSLIMALGMLVDNGIVVVENVYRLMEEGYSPIQATKLGVGEVAWPIIASTATTLAAFLPLALWPGMMGEFMKYLPITLIITLSSSLFVALVINPVLIATFMKVDAVISEKTKRKAKKWFLIGTISGIVLIALGYLVGSTANPKIPSDYTSAMNLQTLLYVIGNLINLIVGLFLLNVFVFMPVSNKFQASVLPILEVWYERTLTFALKGSNPKIFFVGVFALLFFSVGLLNVFPPNVLFFPTNDPKYLNVFVEYPVGTDIETTNRFSKEIQGIITKTLDPYKSIVESVITNVGQGTADPNDPTGIGQSDNPHKARININFVEFNERGNISTSEVMDEIRKNVQGYPGVSITVDKDAVGPPVGKPINIELVGEDLEALLNLSDEMKKFILNEGIEGIEDLKVDIPTGKPELIVNVDRDAARRFGLSTGKIVGEIRTALFGKEISKFKEGEDEYEIQLRLADEFRYDLEALLNKEITFRNNITGKMIQVPISAVATAEYSTTYGSIKRKDLDRVVTLYSNVIGGYNATAVNNQIKTSLQDFQFPHGYSFRFGGEQEKQAEEMAFLSNALLIALFLILIIIISQFNKISSPFIIMTTVLLSTIGVFLGIMITGSDFVIIMTMIGIISLAGIVVNNAIVLIDFIELGQTRLKKELGLEVLPNHLLIQTIISAGKTRLRPVLLTAITTVLGLIPLAIGINIDFISYFSSFSPNFYIGGDNVAFWGPMSWTIIHGLSFATFLTLVIVPVMYLLSTKLKDRLFKRSTTKEVDQKTATTT